jgi:ABC-2 type transport system ATP-binding protein
MNEPAIRVRGLRKAYHGTLAVDGVDIDVEHGEIFALLGPNGAGKTTTVEILEGHRTRDDGEVRVLGVDPAEATASWRARIGMIQQGPAVDFAELTVAEVVRHFAAYYPAPRDPDEVIAMVGLDEKAASRTRQLSGGQRRRLDVALGILGRPQLLFLDEPTTGFDPEARRQFWTLIRALRADGATILLTTHYLEEAEQLADRVAVIDGGRIRAVAPPATVGGRDQAPARVSWRDGAIHRTEATAQPTQLVQRLAERHGGEVPGLTVTRPSLEDIYLGLIGAQQ